MNRLALWLGLLLLVSSTQSCVSSALYDWADEKAPRSEVVGFIDGNGSGDALLVRVHGEWGFSDRLYEMEVVVERVEHAPFMAPAPVQLDDAKAHALESSIDKSNHVATLDCPQARSSTHLMAVDVYSRENGALRRIEDSRKLYFVAVEGEFESPGSPEFTRVSVHRQSDSNGTFEARGEAFLPPPRRKLGRVVSGILVAPIVVAVDVVTLPVQALGMFIAVSFLLSSFDMALAGSLAAGCISTTCVMTGPGLASCTLLGLAMTGHGTEAVLYWQFFERTSVDAWSYLQRTP